MSKCDKWKIPIISGIQENIKMCVNDLRTNYNVFKNTSWGVQLQCSLDKFIALNVLLFKRERFGTNWLHIQFYKLEE